MTSLPYKPSPFYPNSKKKGLALLLQQLSQNQLKRDSFSINELIKNRKDKLKQIRNIHCYIEHSNMKPTKLNYHNFSTIKPISSEEPFLLEKKRNSLLYPDKVFSSLRNMRVDNTVSPPKPVQWQDQQVIDGKFQEYDRLINNQSGQHKKRSIEQSKKLQKLLNQTKYQKTKNQRMKITFFHKYAPDKYHFYPDKISIDSGKSRIFDLTSLRKYSSKTCQTHLNKPTTDCRSNTINTIQLLRMSQQQSVARS